MFAFPGAELSVALRISSAAWFTSLVLREQSWSMSREAGQSLAWCHVQLPERTEWVAESPGLLEEEHGAPTTVGQIPSYTQTPKETV